MIDTTDYQVRTEMLPPQPAPAGETGVRKWIWENLLASMSNFSSPAAALSSVLMIILTFSSILVIYWVVTTVFKFAIIDAIWSGTDGSYCRNANNRGKVPDGVEIGACWAFIDAKFGQLMNGFYPVAERWRVYLTYVIGAAVILPLAIPAIPHKGLNGFLLVFVFPFVAVVLLAGGWFGMPYVETTQWGGLLLTLVIGVTGIVVSLPLGIFLALGRRSKMPAVRLASVIFIELWRGVPLITVLFMSSVMLPLFLPEGVNLNKVVRPLIGVALFSAAYMAEVVRGGLQAIPKGQFEGAYALGLSYWKTTALVTMPQALKLVIPGIVNTFIGLFKDTSLVSIIGLFDLLGMGQATTTDPKWLHPTQQMTLFLFLAITYWIFTFSMSRYSMYTERRLHTGHKR